MSVELREHALGVLLPVRAQPGARRNGVRGEHQGMLRVSVTQTAERGKANDALARVLCKSLKLRGGQLQLQSGATAQNKVFVVREMTVADLAERIALAIAEAVGN